MKLPMTAIFPIEFQSTSITPSVFDSISYSYLGTSAVAFAADDTVPDMALVRERQSVRTAPASRLAPPSV
jgi:hypothetical protein